MKKPICLFILLVFASFSFAQLSFTSQSNDTLLNVKNNGNTKLLGASGVESALLNTNNTDMGFLPPRLTLTQRDAIANPVEGLTIYNTTIECIEIYTGSIWKNICDCNWAPQAHDVMVTGIAWVGETLTGSFTYMDYEVDNPGSPIYHWYRADDAAGTNKTTISGANSYSYTVQNADENKYIAYDITPVALTGVSPGTAVLSAYRGPVVPSSGISHPSGGENLQYGVVYAAGYSWLDRNLGARQVATAQNDYQAYGSLFQWGRIPDGHECITWISSTESDNSEQSNELANACSNNDPTAPCTNNSSNPSAFITLFNWHTETIAMQTWWNENISGLYDPQKGDADPCPAGFRVPNRQEWEAFISEYTEGAGNSAAAAFASPLKLPIAGLRASSGALNHQDFAGYYWASTHHYTDHGFFMGIGKNGQAGIGSQYRGFGQSVRCIEE